jgi:hypothetical protein
MAKSVLRPVAAPVLARIYARVDARTEETVWRVLGQGAGPGTVVTDEHVRLLLDAMSQQNAALHDLRRDVASLQSGQDGADVVASPVDVAGGDSA